MLDRRMVKLLIVVHPAVKVPLRPRLTGSIVTPVVIPMAVFPLGITKHFARYLSLISGGKVSPEFPQADKLDMNIYSGDRLVSYRRLSEGTKETVYLAFRLAVLDHLFPNGGGVIVLDDPLTDMDEERVEQSCALIRDCAERHQVIFLTCREAYLPQLQGNVIRI